MIPREKNAKAPEKVKTAKNAKAAKNANVQCDSVWDEEMKRQILLLSNGTKLFLKLETRITEEMSRWAVISSPDENVGEFALEYGRCLSESGFGYLVSQLLSRGFVLGSDDEKNLIYVLCQMGGSRYRDEYYHSIKGIVQIKGKNYIMGKKIYTKTNAPFKDSAYREVVQDKSVKKPSGNAPKEMPELVVRGDKDTLVQGLKDLVLNRDAIIELVFILGAVGLISKILSGSRRIPNIILSIVSKAFKGKDTILLLPASMWTIPDNLTTSVSTQAGLRKFITAGNIMPVIGNDVTVRCKDLEDTLSAFADGRGLNSHFNSLLRHFIPLLMSSNSSILRMFTSKDDSNRGASRLFEFKQDQFTDDADHAELLAKLCGTVHGIAGEEFLKHLASFGDGFEAVATKMFETHLSEFRKMHPDVNGRQAQQIAVVLTTGQLLGEALGIQFRLDAIREKLVSVSVKASKENETALAVYEEVMHLYQNCTESIMCFAGDYRDFKPEKHIGIVDGDIFYIRGKHITKCNISSRETAEIKAWLVENDLMITGDMGEGNDMKPRGLTYRCTKIKGDQNTFYAFKIKEFTEMN